MKFTCKQKDFFTSLQNVQRAIQPNNTLPVLNNVLIKAENDKVVLSGTNLEIAIKSSFEAKVENSGSFTIPVKLLSSYVALLSESGDIEVQAGSAGFLNIKQGISETKIKGIASDEFPIIPQIEKETEFVMKADDLRTLISQVSFSASTNQSRPILMGILFEIEDNILKLAATDSYRLSEKKQELNSKQENPIKVIIPSKTLMEVSKIVSGKSEVKIMFAKNQVVFEWENVNFISRLIEGAFPDYKSVIPSNSNVKVEVSREELLIAIRKLSIFATETNGSIHMSATNDSLLHVFTDKNQRGESKEEIKAAVEGKNTKVSLNAGYLIDVLQNISTDKVQIEMGEKLTPIMIKPLNKEAYINIIMPLR